MIGARWLAPLLAVAAPAAGDAAPSLAAWHGDWTGEGTAFGRPATATLAIGPAAEAGATRLVYRLTVAGAPAYAAEAMYRVDAAGGIEAMWTDDAGRTRPVRGRWGARQWWVHWGSADVEIGRSTYALESDGSLIVHDSVLADDGGWRSFAMLRYRRSKG